jgi:hypothetical protein
VCQSGGTSLICAYDGEYLGQLDDVFPSCFEHQGDYMALAIYSRDSRNVIDQIIGAWTLWLVIFATEALPATSSMSSISCEVSDSATAQIVYYGAIMCTIASAKHTLLDVQAYLTESADGPCAPRSTNVVAFT